MKLIITLLALNIFVISQNSFSQSCPCTSGGTQYPSGTFTPTSSWQTATTCQYGGEYCLFNVTSGGTYDWSYCTADGGSASWDTQLSVYNNSTLACLAYNDDFCSLQSHVTWTATFTGVVRVKTNLYNCTTNTTCATLVYKGTVPPPSPCICTSSGTQYPSGTFTPTGSWQVATSCQYGGEYNLYNVTSGQTYQWSYCTADGGSSSWDTQLSLYNNSTLACLAFNDDFCGLQSYISWTATFTGVVRVKTNLYSCLTNSTCATLVYRCSSCCTPPTTATVSGPASPCQFSTQTYTASSSGATSYSWTLPAGWSGSSTSSSITVTVGSGSGQVCATPSNGCGSGSQGCQSVTVNQAPTAASVSGPASPCEFSTQTYTASSSGATSYSWTLPAGWSGSSSSSSITVTVGSGSGQVCATPSNSCGSGSQGCQSVTVNQAPTAAIVSGPASPCESSMQTYTASSSGASSYSWTLPAGWSGSSTSSSITVTVGSGSGQVCATPSNSCGSGTQGCQSVTVNLLPSAATISGPVSPCQFSTQTYTASSSGATSYSWTLPAGWSGSSTTSSITVTVGSGSGQVCATPFNSCGSGSQGCQSVTVGQVPTAATVSGSASPCQSSTQTYTASSSGATSYSWTLPAGWSGSSTTSSITVTVGSGSGQVCATPSNSCGSGSQGCQSVTVGQVPTAATVSGPVSPCESSTQTYTASSSGATSYAWTLPSGWSGSSTTSSITVTVGSGSGQVCATPSNSCGSGTQGCQSVTVNLLPSVATISGPASPCETSTQTYTASSTNATSYVWTLPAGWSGSSTTSSITVTVGSGSGQVCATPSNSCGNGTQGCQTVTVGQVPSAATITGPALPCESSMQTYTASSSGATSYSWTLPSGWSGSSTTSSITVTVGSGSGQVCATPSNSCGSGTQGCQSVTVDLLPSAATITGPSAACLSSTQTYTASSSNATSYVWTLPVGWSGSSTTSSITVTVGSGSGQVCATPSNSCGSGAQGCQSVTADQAPGAATVSGPVLPCETSTQTYTASSSNATSYAWTLPSGWSGSSTTSSITVTVGSGSGQVCATPSSSCGSGTQGCQSVTVDLLPSAATITGPASPCESSTQTYTASSSNATSYSWTLPSGWSGSSTTSSITVTVGSGSGQVCATPSNSCGSGTQGCQTVTVNPLPSAATVSGPASPCESSTQTYTASSSNATSYAWTLPAGWSGSSTSSSITVTVGSGSGQVCATPSNSCGSGTQGCQSVTVGQVPAAATVSGPASPCETSTQTYTASSSGATSFIWTLPSGWSGSSTSSSITVTVGSGSGQVCATPSNSCGSGSQGCQTVTVNQVPTATPISGNTSVIQGNIENYSTSSSNATSFIWALPSGWTGSSTTSSITVTVGAGSGSVCVTPSNSCGNGTQVCLAVSTVTSVSENNLSSDFSIYPNPAFGQFFIHSSKTILNADIYVTNVLGEKVFQSVIHNPQSLIDLSHLSGGMYFVHLKFDPETSSGETATQKLIIQK